MFIIIAGCGKVGLALVRQLVAEEHDLTIIDRNPEVLERCVEDYDVMAIHGNCASMTVLKEADAASADLLLAMTNADEVNLLCCMTAHTLNPKLHTVARIRDPEYAQQAISMRNAFALSMVVNPDKSAAREIGRLVKYPGFLKRDTFVKGLIEIVELRIDSQSTLKDISLYKLTDKVKCQVLVCTVLRDGKAIIPAGDFVLREGDSIFVTASAKNLSILLRNLGIIARKARRVLLAGGGRISYYLARILLLQGASVQIIERDEARCRELSELLPEASIIHGDASNQNVLNREGINECDAFITLTGLDELNMVCSLYASKKNVPLIITKIGRGENNSLLDIMCLGSTVCPKELVASSVVRYVRAFQDQVGAAVTMHTIADGQAEALEFIADENTMHCGEPLKELKLKPNVLLAAISGKGVIEIASGNSSFQKGDSVIVVKAGDTAIRQLNDIFEN